MISGNYHVWTLSTDENFSWDTRIKFPCVFLQFFRTWYLTIILICELLNIILRSPLINRVKPDLSSWNASWATTQQSITLIPNDLAVILLSDPLLLVVGGALWINVGSSLVIGGAYSTNTWKLTFATTIILASLQISVPVGILLFLSPIVWILGQGTLIQMQILSFLRTADQLFILILVCALATLLSRWWTSLSNLWFEIGGHVVLHRKPTIRIESIITLSHIRVGFSSIISTCYLVDLLITSLVGALVVVFVGLTTNAYSQCSVRANCNLRRLLNYLTLCTNLKLRLCSLVLLILLLKVDATTLNNLGILLLIVDQIFKILKLLLIHLTGSLLILSILWLLFTHHLCVLLLGHRSMLLLLLFSLILFLNLRELLLVAVGSEVEALRLHLDCLLIRNVNRLVFVYRWLSLVLNDLYFGWLTKSCRLVTGLPFSLHIRVMTMPFSRGNSFKIGVVWIWR